MNIFEFEEKYKNILEDIEEWNYLRISVGFYLKNRNNVDKCNTKKVKSKLQKVKFIFKLFQNAFYGFKNWFGHYDYLVFSDSGQQKEINGKYYNKIIDKFILTLKFKRILLIEQPTLKHYNKTKNRYIVSEEIFTIIFLLLNIALNKYKKKNNKINKLIEILKKEQIDIDVLNIINSFHIKYRLYKLLLLIYKPKKIFLTCYYCRSYLVKAANDLNIKVIEFQHGIINNMHYAYINYNNIHKSKYYPSILLSFGKQEIQLKNMLIKKVVPIGNFYLEYMVKNFVKNQQLENIIQRYKISIGISMQDQDWERELIFEFLEKCAIRHKDILFIIIPRNIKDFPSIANNVIVYDKLDCYNIIMHCDIHMTLYSSCALEAPTLGIPNILLNKRNFAKDYYSDILDDFNTKYINDVNELKNTIQKVLLLNKKDIIESNEGVFYPNYEQNILNFMKVDKTNEK